jgi:protein TonB
LAAIALHALAGFALLSYEPARSALFAAAPIMVDLITSPKVEPEPEPPVEIVPPKPKPKPVVKRRPRPPEPKPVIAAPVEAPAPVVTAPPPPPPEPAPAPVVAAPPAPPAPAPVVPVTAPVFNADYLDNPPPRYPALSRRIGEKGRVILRVLVNASGAADEVQIRRSSGHARLDEAARGTVRRWKFVPAKRGEQPVAAWVLIPISFRLEG